MLCTLDLYGSAIALIVNEFVNSSDTFNPHGFFFEEEDEYVS